MNGFKKILLFLPLFLAQYACAGLETKIHGGLNFQSASCHQKKLKADKKNRSANKDNPVFFSSANVKLEISNTTDTDLKYGGRIVLKTTQLLSGGSSNNNSHIFIEDEWGIFQLGSPPNVASTMSINAYDIAKATGDDWSRYAKLNPEDKFGMDFITYDFPAVSGVSTYNTTKKPKEAARNITYYTPKYNGLQFGISYIPDTSNNGQYKISRDISQELVVPAESDHVGLIGGYTVKIAAKDVVVVGLSHEYNIEDGVDLKSSIVGEFGKATQEQIKPTKEKLTGDRKLKNLKGYNVGAILNLGNFSYSLSYGDFGKSFTSKAINSKRRNTNMYSTGIAYTQGPAGISLTYLNTNNYKNKLQAITLGTEYKLAEGLLPYAEINFVQAKGNSLLPIKDSLQKHTHKATVFILGLKLSFIQNLIQ